MILDRKSFVTDFVLSSLKQLTINCNPERSSSSHWICLGLCFETEKVVAQYPIQIAKKVANRITMAAFWIESHDPICAATENSIRARVAVSRLGWKGEKETGQFALSVQLFLNRTLSHVSTGTKLRIYMGYWVRNSTKLFGM